LFERQKIAVEMDFAGVVALREFIRVRFGPDLRDLGDLPAYLNPSGRIGRINRQQRYMAIGAHVAPFLAFQRRIDKHVFAVVVGPNDTRLRLTVRHHGR